MLKASLPALMLMPQFGSSKRIHKKWAMMGRFIQGLFIMSILAPVPCLCLAVTSVIVLYYYTYNCNQNTTNYKYPIFLIA